MKILALLAFLSCLPLYGITTEERFNEIYREKKWGVNEAGEGFSGDGSTVRNAAVYMKFLQDFIVKNKIKKVVDLGCGDWTFSRYIDWKGAKYIGIDVVKAVIEKDIEMFASKKITFIHSDGMEMALPKADLLICKDVLQHLPDAEIHKLLGQLSKFKHCLITNDVNPTTKSSENIENDDLTYGRHLDLTKPPFNVKGEKVLLYNAGWDTKQVLHIKKP